MNYIEHLEKHCGEITGNLELEDMMEQNIQFLKFENAPINESYTATSLGLLWHSLQFEDGQFAHQEVMMSVKQLEAEEDVIELLWRLTTHALETDRLLNWANSTVCLRRCSGNTDLQEST